MMARRKKAPRVWSRTPFRRRQLSRFRLRMVMISTPTHPDVSWVERAFMSAMSADSVPCDSEELFVNVPRGTFCSTWNGLGKPE